MRSRSANPARQATHSALPAAPYDPAAQAAHGVDASASESAKPTAHSVHSVALPAACLPGLQASHAVDALLSMSACPAAHSVHSVLSTLTTLPASHVWQGSVEFSSGEYWPAAHAEQESLVPVPSHRVYPNPGWHDAEHGRQFPVPASPYSPGSQVAPKAHALPSVLGLVSPVGQGSHCTCSFGLAATRTP